MDLFAGMPVSDYERAIDWYSRLLGAEPTFFPNSTEAVWELAEHRFLYVELAPERAGGGLATVRRPQPTPAPKDLRRRSLPPWRAPTTSRPTRSTSPGTRATSPS